MTSSSQTNCKVPVALAPHDWKITQFYQGGSCSNEEGEEDDKDINRKERPTRLNLKTSRARSHSSTPSTQKLPKNIGRSGSLAILPKSMSCRSPGESKGSWILVSYSKKNT
ncbi:hypothetical protein OIU76_020999 [Salix suchowensis]|uniref:Uncharacterized protein n=1 Tax=Salix suchowensis TaxID=1278906 RepID=A0ABQ8ZP86_9ROSI|nr:hypothetical protein OIU76_020999 [Salix suchowensis]KAJ6303718.1 hypothetical protein OIU77_017572 [Salix suchowensis]